MNKKIKIEDIAKDAGVSLATVSRCINHKGIVKEETYNKVIASARRLGYELEPVPYDASETDKLILFNLPSLGNPFFSEVVYGAKMSARRFGYQMLILEDVINTENIGTVLSLIRRTHAAGLITVNQIAAPILSTLSSSIPLVQCCEYNEALDLPRVSCNDRQAAANVVSHLISLGRKRVAFLNGSTDFIYGRCRLEGYRDALAKAGIPFDESLVILIPNGGYDLAVSAAMQIINSENPPDAFFACSDVYAAAILRAAHLTGFRVPGDIAVSGFDNISLSTSTTPTITTVNQPKSQLGFTAAELLIERIQNPQAPVKNVVLDAELIIRESTAV